jgi:hypothetical protein
LENRAGLAASEDDFRKAGAEAWKKGQAAFAAVRRRS